MIYGCSLEAQATASLAAATGYDSHIFDLFRPQPALRSIPIRRSFCCAMISNPPVLQAAREAKPFISAHWAAIEPTRYVCKAPRAGMVQGGDSANWALRRDIPQSPGCAYSGTLRAGRSRLCTSPSEEDHARPRRPDPCGRAWKGAHLRGEIPISVSVGVSPRRLRLIAGHLKKTGELSDLAIEPQITTNDLRLMLRLAFAGGGITIATRKLSGHILKAVGLYLCLMTFFHNFRASICISTASQYCTKAPRPD